MGCRTSRISWQSIIPATQPLTSRDGMSGNALHQAANDPSAGNLLVPGRYGVIAPEESPDRTTSRLVRYYDYLSSDASVRIFIVVRKTFSLNNNTDCVTLRDSDGTVIDSVSHSSTWHNPYLKNTRGRSLEKFNDLLASNSPASWSSSTDMERSSTKKTWHSHGKIWQPDKVTGVRNTTY